MLNYYVNVFFKTNTLSEHFVTLSAERCPFPAWFPTSKNSISATFSPIFLCLSALRFSHSEGIFAHGIPHQNPLHFPHSSSLSGGILRSHLLPSNSPCLLPFQSVRQAEFIPKTRRFRSKLKPFRGESSPARGRREGLFRGEFGHFPSKNPSERGWIGVVWGMEIKDFCTKDTPEREKIGERRGGKMGTKKGPQRFATSPPQGVIIREILCAS